MYGGGWDGIERDALAKYRYMTCHVLSICMDIDQHVSEAQNSSASALVGTLAMGLRRSLLAGLALLLSATAGWPHFLLDDACEKGAGLVDSVAPLPRIMNVIPSRDYILDVLDGEHRLQKDDEVEVGRPLTLVYAGVHRPDTHTVFVSSGGDLVGAQACGEKGASLLCSSCGAGWLHHATWAATTPGQMQLAVGAAHGTLGTPAVFVGNLTLRAVAARGGEACSGRGGARRRDDAGQRTRECRDGAGRAAESSAVRRGNEVEPTGAWAASSGHEEWDTSAATTDVSNSVLRSPWWSWGVRLLTG